MAPSSGSNDVVRTLNDARVSRRQALRALLVGVAAIGVAACSQPAPPAAPPAKPAEPAKPAADPAKPVGINPVAAPPAAPTTAPAVASKPAEAAKPATGTVNRGGTLTTAVPNHVVTLDPHNSVNGTDEHVYRHVYDTLVDIDNKGNVLPKLATSWEIADTSITFKLRPGVKFHDGTDLNAEAVKANFDRLLDPNLKMVMRGSMSDIMGSEIVDPMTVKLVMRGPSAPTFAGLAGRGGSIVSPTAVQKFGKDYPLNPVGTGPYVFQEWIKDNKVTLKRSESYWMKAPDGSQLPYLDTLVMRSIIDDSVRLVELQTNNIQIMETVPPKDVGAIQSNPALAYLKLDGLPYHYRLNFNTTKAPFDNKVLRQAFCWAVNRETMVRVLAFGQGVPSKSVWPAGSWMADPNANAYGYDPEKAKALFKESGVTSLEFPIVVFTRDEDQLLGQMLQSQLQEVGVKLNIESVERSSGVERYRSGDFLMGIGRFSTEGDPDLQINQFLGKTANNYWTNYDSAVFNDLRNKAAGTYDVAQRKAFYTELDKVLLGDAPAVELYKRDWAHALSTKIKGFDTTARGMWILTSAWLEK